MKPLLEDGPGRGVVHQLPHRDLVVSQIHRLLTSHPYYAGGRPS